MNPAVNTKAFFEHATELIVSNLSGHLSRYFRRSQVQVTERDRDGSISTGKIATVL